MQEVADHSDIIFVAVQTPHNSLYEGVDTIPAHRVDFDYSWLVEAITRLSECVKKETVIVIISTCLPGTMRREIMPKMNKFMKLVYNPFFIAMGTTMRDFMNPEFILLGSDDSDAQDKVINFYRTIHGRKEKGMDFYQTMSVESAELTKVCYNTFISTKIAFANTVMEICEHFDEADCDEIINALSQATDRIISPLYLRGGMGDGGGCHPRDNIAMSWLARKVGLSYDLFESIMYCREDQADWLADSMIEEAKEKNLALIILGYAFKPQTNLIVGSPALLVSNLLKKRGTGAELIDEHITGIKRELTDKAVYLIGCKHAEYKDTKFPKGSIVIDPHRYIPDQEGVVVRRLGERK